MSVAWQATNAATAGTILAGTGKRRITPPIGGAMGGFGFRDHGSAGVRDDLHVRCLWLQQADHRLLLISLDVAALDCAMVAEWKVEIAERFGVQAHEVLLNMSHTHSGPLVIERFYKAADLDEDYLRLLRSRIMEAIAEASRLEEGCTLAFGRSEVQLGICRRHPDGAGGVTWAPYPAGYVERDLPVLQVLDRRGEPLCVVFAAAAHPSLFADYLISADYPGVACRLVEQAIGGRVQAMFMQGAAGDAKVNVNADVAQGKWIKATAVTVKRAGRVLADGVLQVLAENMAPLQPALAGKMAFPALPTILPADTRSYYETMRKAGYRHTEAWSNYHLARLERGEEIDGMVTCPMQMIRLAPDLYLLSLAGELTGALAKVLRDGLDAPGLIILGYSNGSIGYLPSATMLEEGGYEAERSVYQGRVMPAPFAPGIEAALRSGGAALLQELSGD